MRKMARLHVMLVLGIHTQECTYSTGGNGQQQVNNLWRTHKKGIDSYMRSLAVGTDTAVGNFSTCWTNKQPYTHVLILHSANSQDLVKHTTHSQFTAHSSIDNMDEASVSVVPYERQMKTVVHASKSKRKRELDEDYKSIEEQHYEMLKDQVEFCCEQVEKLQRLLNREVYRGRKHTFKRIKFDKYGHSNVTL